MSAMGLPRPPERSASDSTHSPGIASSAQPGHADSPTPLSPAHRNQVPSACPAATYAFPAIPCPAPSDCSPAAPPLPAPLPHPALAPLPLPLRLPCQHPLPDIPLSKPRAGWRTAAPALQRSSLRGPPVLGRAGPTGSPSQPSRSPQAHSTRSRSSPRCRPPVHRAGGCPRPPSAPTGRLHETRHQATWANQLVDGNGKCLPHLYTVDPTLHRADRPAATRRPTFNTTPGAVSIVTHLHRPHTVEQCSGAWFACRSPRTAHPATRTSAASTTRYRAEAGGAPDTEPAPTRKGSRANAHTSGARKHARPITQTPIESHERHIGSPERTSHI